MGVMKKAGSRDVTKRSPRQRFVKHLRALADALEQGESFRFSIAGERVVIPADAVPSIEHERTKTDEEIEFQLTWKRQGTVRCW